MLHLRSSTIAKVIVILACLSITSPTYLSWRDPKALLSEEKCHQESPTGQGLGDWMPNEEAGWIEAPRGSFRALISIQGPSRLHVCSGVLISSRYILTAANCIDVVGPNPIVVIGPHSRSDNRWTSDAQELRAEMAHIHPNWMGEVQRGYDVALLRLSKDINVLIPTLAPPSLRLYPNMRVYGFQLTTNLTVSQFKIVANELCPQLQRLVPDMFCTYSVNANMDEGSAGSPIVIVNDDEKWGNQAGFTLLGIVSYANTSLLQESGTGCACISDVHGWIKHIISQQSDMVNTVHMVIWVAIAAFIVTVVFNFLPSIPWRVSMALCLAQLMLLFWMVKLWAEVARDSFPEYEYFINSIWRDLSSTHVAGIQGSHALVLSLIAAAVMGAAIRWIQYPVFAAAWHPCEDRQRANGQLNPNH